jgi:DNA-binding transcriptional MocR family regulator
MFLKIKFVLWNPLFLKSVPLVSEFPFPVWARISASVHKKMHQLHLGYDDAQGYLPLRKALPESSCPGFCRY